MGQERRHFTDEFKRESVALLASSGRSLGQIAGELGISPSMLRNWRNRSDGRGAGTALHSNTSASTSSPDRTAEIARLRRENDRLRMERDILKRMARPVRKRLVRGDLTGLRQRIRSRGRLPWPRWSSARSGPHKGDGIDVPFFKPGCQSAGSTVRPSRCHHPQISGTAGPVGPVSNLIYTAVGRSLILAL